MLDPFGQAFVDPPHPENIPIEKCFLSAVDLRNLPRGNSYDKKIKIDSFIEENNYSKEDLMYVAFFYSMGFYGKHGRSFEIEERLKDGDKTAFLDDMKGSWTEVQRWDGESELLYWAYSKRQELCAKRIYIGIALVKEYFNELSNEFYLWK